MKYRFFFSLLMILPLSAAAQLKVDSVGHVSIATVQSNIMPRLAVGDDCANNDCIGVSAAPEVKYNKNNVGVFGKVVANQSFTSDKNYGVYGSCQVNSNHGRNFGVSGMLTFSPGASNYGGAGVFAADYSYLFSNPVNIQGLYALYTYGPTHISGQMTAQEIYTPADERLSEDVEPIAMDNRDEGQAIDNLLKMNVLEFRLKSHEGVKAPEDMNEMTEDDRQAYEYLKKREDKVLSRRHFGLSAQELQKIYPNLVLEGQDGYLYVNYTELVPILIRSIQELKAELDDVKEKSSNARQTRSAFSGGDEEFTEAASRNILYQNTPNPFKEQTTIRFSLADDVTSAAICIFDMSGKMLKKLPVSSGETSVSVNGWELGEGLYLYSLVVNGQEIDTKKMIITQ